jgi:hypothetical protein
MMNLAKRPEDKPIRRSGVMRLERQRFALNRPQPIRSIRGPSKLFNVIEHVCLNGNAVGHEIFNP